MDFPPMLAKQLPRTHLPERLRPTYHPPVSLAANPNDSRRRWCEMLKWIQKLAQKTKRVDSFEALLQGSDALKAKTYQDVFALISSDFKRNGYFVEFGAADGVGLSTTWILEKKFAWDGILAEPGRNWHHALLQNRSCNISTDCVWAESGKKLTFLESTQPVLSTLIPFSTVDGRDRLGREHEKYEVNTTSLVDLLRRFDAPTKIDFMSVDTEGSEFEILDAFDWGTYSINALCIEHNYTSTRGKIHKLLLRNGYRRVYEGVSGADDWYVKNEHDAIPDQPCGTWQRKRATKKKES